MSEENTTYLPPREYTPQNIIFWEPLSKTLVTDFKNESRPLIAKARKFLENNCIEQINNASWICGPIKGYNKTSYNISHNNNGFTCNCQGFNKRREEGATLLLCSHILAVKQFNYIEVHNG